MIVIPSLHRFLYQDHCQHHILPLSASSARLCYRKVELDEDGVGHVVVVVVVAAADDGIVMGIKHVVVVDRYVLIDRMCLSRDCDCVV